jgi:hypothetical protein
MASNRRDFCWIPTDAGIDRIVNAVWLDAGSWSNYASRLDRDRLIDHLFLAWNRWLTFVALDRKPSVHESKQREKQKKLLYSIVDAQQDFRDTVLEMCGHKYPTVLSALNDTIKMAADAAEQANSQGGRIRLPRSPKEWFAVEVLAPIYEYHFKRRAGPSAEAKEGGPFIRFAIQVMKEMGIRPLTPNTVARALKEVRAGHERPKGRSSVQRRQLWCLNCGAQWVGGRRAGVPQVRCSALWLVVPTNVNF